eukprot:scaffold21809_cov52-Attheya_sp.AAC.4
MTAQQHSHSTRFSMMCPTSFLIFNLLSPRPQRGSGGNRSIVHAYLLRKMITVQIRRTDDSLPAAEIIGSFKTYSLCVPSFQFRKR